MQQEYRIATWRLEGVHKKLATLQKKAAQFGQALTVETIREETEPVLEPNPDTGQDEPTGLLRHYTVMQLTGVEPVINGYRFVGTLEHHEAGNVFRPVPGERFPEWLRMRPRQCDHCHTARDRKDTYVIYAPAVNADIEYAGEGADDMPEQYRQIGRSCLKDYLGGHDPHALLALLEGWAEFEAELQSAPERDEWAEFRSGRAVELLEIETVLTYAAAASSQFGYVSRKQSQERDHVATADRVLENLDPSTRSKLKERDIIHPQAAHTEEMQNALAWIRGQDTAAPDWESERNDYIRNLYYLCQEPAVSARNFGFVVSLIPSYRRHVEKATAAATIKREQPKSAEYVGELKQRLTLLLTVTRVHDYESDFNGVTHIHNFTDAEGHRFVWFTGSQRLEEGKAYPITGTVKDHKLNARTGHAETILTRCKVDISQAGYNRLAVAAEATTREAPGAAPLAEVDAVTQEVNAQAKATAERDAAITQLQAAELLKLLDHSRRIITADDLERVRQGLQDAQAKHARDLQRLKDEAAATLDKSYDERPECSNDARDGWIRSAITQAEQAQLMGHLIAHELREQLYSSDIVSDPGHIADYRRMVSRYIHTPLAERVPVDQVQTIMNDAIKLQDAPQEQAAAVCVAFAQVFHAMTHAEAQRLRDAIDDASAGRLDGAALTAELAAHDGKPQATLF